MESAMVSLGRDAVGGEKGVGGGVGEMRIEGVAGCVGGGNPRARPVEWF